MDIRKSKKVLSIILLLLTMAAMQIIPFTVKADTESTIVEVNPTYIDVVNGDVYTVNINVTPSMNSDIAGMQVSLNFDHRIINVTNVSEGNLFMQNGSSRPTFFASGLIDNVKGIVSNIEDVILGNETVNSFGTFATITFVAEKSGRATFILSNVVAGFTLMDIVNGDISAGSIPVAINDYSNYVPPETTATTTTITTTTTMANSGRGGSKQSVPSIDQSQGDIDQDVVIADTSPATILAQNIIPILIVVFGIIFIVSEMMLDSTTNSLIVSVIGIVIVLTFLGIVGTSL